MGEEDMHEQTANMQIKRLSDVPRDQIPEAIDDVVKVEHETWPEEIQASRAKFESRAQVFPEGFLTISLPNLGMVGVSTSEIINYDSDSPPISWEETTDNGWIRNHKPNGTALYLVSVGASPRSSGLGVGTRLVEEQINLAKKLKLAYLVLGSRVPGYHQYHKEYPEASIEQYLALKRDDGQPLDPEIRFYSRSGLEVVKVVPNYMEDDPESENYGVVMVWKSN